MAEIGDVTELHVDLCIIKKLKCTSMCTSMCKDCTNQKQQEKVDNECQSGASDYVIDDFKIKHTMVLKSRSFILWKFFIEKL